MAPQSHQSAPEVLNRRTLERDHRRLAACLRPGMAVLDVGCGTGAITAGIARLVGPEGRVLGVDRDGSLLDIARQVHHELPNLRFERADVLSLPFDRDFDVATAARTLQWVSDPARAVDRMARAVREGGRVLVLDYNHCDNAWEPEPPVSFVRFYDEFLAWRSANGWDNSIAANLAALFERAGLAGIQSHADDEIASRDDDGFEAAAAIWGHVISSIGPRLVAAGFLAEPERAAAARDYEQYVASRLMRQILCMRTVEGQVTAPSGA